MYILLLRHVAPSSGSGEKLTDAPKAKEFFCMETLPGPSDTMNTVCTGRELSKHADNAKSDINAANIKKTNGSILFLIKLSSQSLP